MKKVVTKTYADIPFAHRQPNHTGHCRMVHGHNWSFKLIFGCEKVDANGFVVDFGELGWIRDWLNETFDHKLVLNKDDQDLAVFTCLQHGGFADITLVPNCGAEGLAEYVLTEVNGKLERNLGVEAVRDRKLRLLSVHVAEDSKNTAVAQITE